MRYYAQMRDLVATLQDNGFDVRIVSASPEPVVRVWAADVGISADRAMGTRTEHDGDVLTTRLALCGGEPSVPYNEGKRCRVNEQVFGVQGPGAFDQLPEQQRQVFGAGDSDGDATFIGDATALRLVINRNQIELMCRAYANLDGRWLVNPMFIDPLGISPPYPCAAQGFDEPNGDQTPLLRPDGSVVPDQQTAYIRRVSQPPIRPAESSPSAEESRQHRLGRRAQFRQRHREQALKLHRVRILVDDADADGGKPPRLAHRAEPALLGAGHRDQHPARRFGEQHHEWIGIFGKHDAATGFTRQRRFHDGLGQAAFGQVMRRGHQSVA